MAAARYEPEGDPAWIELRPVLHEEVNRLPEKYRSPVVLCYFEGRTNEEAAALLDWPVGTVKGRLSRARDLLRSRLLRRGLVLSAAFLMWALSSESVFAEVVPSRLVDETAQAAMAVRKGRVGPTTLLLSPAAWDLAEESFSLSRGDKAKVRRRRVFAIVALAASAAAVAYELDRLPGLPDGVNWISSSRQSVTNWVSAAFSPAPCH
jgi:hypothetical protein